MFQREKLLPYVSYSIFAIGVVIFLLRYWSMQPGNFSEHGLPELMTKAEKENWLDTYDLVDAVCWVIAFIAMYLSTFYVTGKKSRNMRIALSVMCWTTVTNLLDEKFWDNTMVHKDEYYFLIIIVIHAIVYGIYNNVKRKGIRANGMGG